MIETKYTDVKLTLSETMLTINDTGSNDEMTQIILILYIEMFTLQWRDQYQIQAKVAKYYENTEADEISKKNYKT